MVLSELDCLLCCVDDESPGAAVADKARIAGAKVVAEAVAVGRTGAGLVDGQGCRQHQQDGYLFQHL